MTEAENSTTTEIVPVERRAIQALDSDKTAARIAEEVAKTADIVACNDKPGRELVHKAAMRHRDIRLSIQRASSAAREDAVALQKAVIAEEKRLVGLVQPEEDRLITIRDGFDAEQERIRQAAIEAERARIAKVNEAISRYRDMPLANMGQPSTALHANISALEASSLPELEYKGEEENQVRAARQAAIEKLTEMHSAAFEREFEEQKSAEARAAEEARIKAEREAEAKRQAEARAELERQQAELAAARAKVEAEAAEQRRKQEAELSAQREQMARERAALEAERAKAAEALREAEAKQAEIERQRVEAEKAANPAPAPEVVDTRPVITVELEHADETLAPVPEAPPTLRLGEISRRFGFVVTADFLLSLGFAHSGTDKAAKLFHESEFKAICAALIRHISAVAAKA